MLNWSFWWIELGIVHGSRLDLLMTSILSLFGVFFPLLIPTTHARLLEFARTSKRERYPSHERTGLFFSCCFFSSFSWSFVYMYESEEGRRAEMKMRYLSIRKFFVSHVIWKITSGT